MNHAILCIMQFATQQSRTEQILRWRKAKNDPHLKTVNDKPTQKENEPEEVVETDASEPEDEFPVSR